jgi:uncharacterized protein YcaQ
MKTAHQGAAISLSQDEAIRIAYGCQYRSGAERRAAMDAATSPIHTAAAHLGRIGHVQIDTISVVQRAHHHAFWSRDRAYRPEILPLLETAPRRVFEYWAHAAAYLPIEDYRYCLPRMKRVAETGHQWFPTDPTVVAAVLERIRAEGPLKSSDFGGDGPRGPWWDWKPAKAALEYLFMAGVLLVVSRPGFQKLYNIAERVLPPGLDTRFPTNDEQADWYVRRTALAHGVFAEIDVAYMRKDGLDGIRPAIERAVEAGFLSTASIAGEEDRRCWVLSDALCLTSSGLDRTETRPVRIISPFDTYIIDRKRAARVLEFQYTLECYVPEAKRRFGYFALPVLWHGKPVGLVDCKADRKAGVLIIKHSSLPVDPPSGFQEAFEGELSAFAAFNGCDSIERG